MCATTICGKHFPVLLCGAPFRVWLWWQHLKSLENLERHAATTRFFRNGCRDRGSIMADLRLVIFAITISLADCSDGRCESHSGTHEHPQPGLADFIPTYGLAMLVSHPKTSSIRVMSSWWSRHVASMTCDSCPAKSSDEDCMRGTVAMVRDIGLSLLNAYANLVKQSMSAYMALELPEQCQNTAAVAASITCFDACCLIHLAR